MARNLRDANRVHGIGVAETLTFDHPAAADRHN
jgi:hypothetical protein